jgi:predicted phage tail protein
MISRRNQAAASHTGASVVAGAPTGVSATGGTGNATISFTAPASNGGSPITSYRVTSAGATVTTVSGTSSPINVSGLSAGTYTFTVRAVNGAGTGPASTASSSVTVNAASMSALTRSGSSLLVAGAAKRFSGLNAYWVGLDDNNGVSTGSFPSHTQITNAMVGMKELPDECDDI